MGRTLILSQRQLNEIMDGDMSYLDGLNSETAQEGDVPEYMGHNQVTVNGLTAKRNSTGKDLSDTMGDPENPYVLGTRTHTGSIVGPMLEKFTKKEFEKAILSEINTGLNGQNMTATFNENPLNPQDAQTIQGNESVLAKHKTEAAQSGDVTQFNALNNVLKTRRDAANRSKKLMKNLGIGTKPQGKAHTPKNPSFNTYLNNN